MGKQKICVIGLGYIGLPTASLLASRGHEVVGVDIDRRVVSTINKGEIHIKEPELQNVVAEAVSSGMLRAQEIPCSADVFIITVPTPFNNDKSPDLSFVRSAAESIVQFVRKGDLVILESTSPVGTTQNMIVDVMRRSGLKIGEELYIAYSPERVLPGKIMRELISNDRVVGGINKPSAEKAGEFYRSYVEGEVYLTDAKTAEMVKLVENSFRDVNIAFANEISMIAERSDIDPWGLVELVNKHPRVKMLKPGPGVGGHCIAVDPWFLISQFPDLTKLLSAARNVNDKKAEHVYTEIIKRAEKDNIRKIACLGLTYKEDIDDIRESPALKITNKLHENSKYEVFACDPNVDPVSVPGLNMSDINVAIKQCEMIVILVAHKEILGIDWGETDGKVVLDFKGVLRAKK